MLRQCSGLSTYTYILWHIGNFVLEILKMVCKRLLPHSQWTDEPLNCWIAEPPSPLYTHIHITHKCIWMSISKVGGVRRVPTNLKVALQRDGRYWHQQADTKQNMPWNLDSYIHINKHLCTDFIYLLVRLYVSHCNLFVASANRNEGQFSKHYCCQSTCGQHIAFALFCYCSFRYQVFLVVLNLLLFLLAAR